MEPSSSPNRISSVDILRGLVMVLMVVDHVRYPYFTNIPFWPEDLQNTTLPLFLTRWITHFCAPLFFFLAGTSTYLSRHFKQTTVRQAAGHLWKRGLWLVLLEVTVIDFSWGFMPGWMFGGVIWSLGWCMVILAGVIYLPMRALTIAGLVIVAGHHALQAIPAETFGSFVWLWNILYGGAPLSTPWLPAERFPILYTLLPHIGLMMLGYALGPQLLRPAAERSRFLLMAGGFATVLFVLLRATNIYGNPSFDGWGDFTVQDTLAKSVVAFLNVQKYPFSLQFMLMTVGPGLVLMGILEDNAKHGTKREAEEGVEDGKARSAEREALEAGNKTEGDDEALGPVTNYQLQITRWLGNVLTVFGRVPLFFYLIHIPLIHVLAIVTGWVMGWPTDWLFGAALPMRRQAPPEFGFGLGGTWMITIGVVMLLYFPCRWFMGLKGRRKDWWVRYL